MLATMRWYTPPAAAPPIIVAAPFIASDGWSTTCHAVHLAYSRSTLACGAKPRSGMGNTPSITQHILQRYDCNDED